MSDKKLYRLRPDINVTFEGRHVLFTRRDEEIVTMWNGDFRNIFCEVGNDEQLHEQITKVIGYTINDELTIEQIAGDVVALLVETGET